MVIDDDKLIIGKINGVFGVQGWLKIFSHTSPRKNILQYSSWLIKLNGQWQSSQVIDGKSQQGGKTVVVKLAGCNDRDSSRELMGCEIAIFKDQLPALTDGYYWIQLIGSKVTNLQNQYLGLVTSLVATGTHDVLRVEKDGFSTLIPFVEDRFVLDINVCLKEIKVDWLMDNEL
jgi:16S rRNA processing protein RimM